MFKAFPWDKAVFTKKIMKAVCNYWNVRQKQACKQAKDGKKDAGTRGEVTGGKHLDSFGKLIVEVILAAGAGKNDVFFTVPLPLPGYYRPQKMWDIVVARNDHLIAAIELKSQSGSFGNNFNNRTEEVIGLSRDFWIAYREKAFGVQPAPWLGYLFFLEDSPKSSSPVRLARSKFPPLTIFNKTSYQSRYRILCERLVLERDYTSTALLVASKTRTVSEPAPELTLWHFCRSLFNHIQNALNND